MLNASDSLAMRLMAHAKGKVVTYNQPQQSDWYLDDIGFDDNGFGSGTVVRAGDHVASISLPVPGLHNLKNALAATAFAAEIFGVDPMLAAVSLKRYKLAGRRFELIGERDGVKIYHDYAHHPSEIEACLEAAKIVPHKKLWAVFQCNSYTRARTLMDKYARCFYNADEVLMPDIYQGRDTDTQGVHALDVVSAINKNSANCLYIPTFGEIREYLHKNWKSGDIVITLGSGDINKQQMVFLK
jgi:UDP-N-acetylmuramate--alanine ligase